MLTAWGGDCAGMQPEQTCLLAMKADKTVSATFGKAPTPVGQQPAPELITVATGKAGELLLEWRIGHDPEGVTCWQYRQQEVSAQGVTGAWGRWTDVRGGARPSRHGTARLRAVLVRGARRRGHDDGPPLAEG